MGRDLRRELLDVLDDWRDKHVTVRVVVGKDELIVVFAGTLRARVSTKGSSAFWPVATDDRWCGLLEQPGVYAHTELLSDVRLHAGKFVVEFTQGEVTVNVRLLDGP